MRVHHPVIRIASALLLLVVALSVAARAQESEVTTAVLTPTMKYSTDSVAPHRFVAAHGSRAIVMGYPESGLEVWAYPFQILDKYQVRFRPSGSNAAKDARLLLRRVDYLPDCITRTYIGPDFLVRERIFVPMGEAAAVITYDVEGIRPLDVEVHFAPVLNLMWPGGLGGQYTRWKGVETGGHAIPGFVIAGQGNDLEAMIGSREVAAHDDTGNSTILTEHGYSFLLHPVGQPARATVYINLVPTSKDPGVELEKLAGRLPALEAQASAHYQALEMNFLRIHTPDEEMNRSFAWAKVALDQAWVCNPRLGCGIVAGYGPSRDALRPQYAWYFGGDGLVATNALVSAGEYDRARDELRFIQKYQNSKNGMIWHELSQSAGYMDWLKLPYMYVHVDISFDYLDALARYVEASGDVAFARESWASIAAAYNYCESSIGTDHLPHIPPDKEASDEQHRPADDLSLSASWMAAASGYRELALLTDHPKEAEHATRQVELTRHAIADHYWNASANFWFDGHTSSGEPIYREAIGPSQLTSQQVFSPRQNKYLLDRLTSADFQVDWGTREVAESAKDYNPYSYGAGSVSPLSTMTAAISIWKAHRPESAFAIWKGVMDWSTFDSMGHVHEVMAGNFYHEQTESVPEQTWSSAALLDATVRGLLGLTMDAAHNRIELAPHLPATWHETTIENVKLPASRLAFTIRQSGTSLDLDVDDQGAPVLVVFDPQIPLGADRLRASFQGRKVDTALEGFGSDEHARVTLQIPSGPSHFHLDFSGGVSVILASAPLQIGSSSIAPKLVNLSLRGKVLEIEADVASARTASFRLRTPWKIVGHPGSQVSDAGSGEYRIQLEPLQPGQTGASLSKSYRRVRVEITLDK